MAIVNHAKKEINAKLVYYGPTGSGKGAILHYIYSRIKSSLRGELKNVPAGGDSLLFFDFSPFELPMADGYRLRLHVYTLVGQVTNPATWKMTLKGADGLVIVLDPAPDRFVHARESVSELRDLLSAYGVGLLDIPAVLQLNSSEMETSAGDVSQVALALDLPHLTTYRSNAASGEGVLDVLSMLARLVLERVAETGKRSEPTGGDTGCSVDEDSDDLEGPLESAERSCNGTVSATKVDISADADKMPLISIVSDCIGVEGTVLRIPIDISCGDACRRLVITVSADVL
jgi:signal recognition particle receptor subunit beta